MQLLLLQQQNNSIESVYSRSCKRASGYRSSTAELRIRDLQVASELIKTRNVHSKSSKVLRAQQMQPVGGKKNSFSFRHFGGETIHKQCKFAVSSAKRDEFRLSIRIALMKVKLITSISSLIQLRWIETPYCISFLPPLCAAYKQKTDECDIFNGLILLLNQTIFEFQSY